MQILGIGNIKNTTFLAYVIKKHYLCHRKGLNTFRSSLGGASGYGGKGEKY